MLTCKLPKKKIIDLMEKVVFPVSAMIKEKCEDYDKIFKFKMALTKLALILLLPDRDKIKVFKNKGITLKNLHIFSDENEDIEVLKEFLELHSKWEHKNCGENNNMEEEEFVEEFFDFDSEDIDETINNMHYEDKDKISAVIFMKNYGIDDDFSAELNDLTLQVNEFIYEYEDIELSLAFFEKIDFLQNFIKTFEFSGEFMDIGYALEMFNTEMNSLDISILNSQQKEVLKLMIISIITDLNKWIEEVILNQTAEDIHYLDASLLANIAQIDIMLKSFDNKEEEEDEDEFEMF